jgi:demethylmenaquinone methyltransferase/2-methoxy-6-polyprenyl-1,4-benzoquinol methylase
VDQRELWEPLAATSQDIAAAQRFYTRISHVYDALTDAGEHTARDLGLQMLDAQTDEQILEVGFATGTGVVHIARAVGEHGRVLGLDISEGMRNVAARRVASSDVSAVVELQIAAIPPIPARND